MGCAGNQCCANQADDISICELILGIGQENATTPAHFQCWTRMSDDLDQGQQICQGCDTGCIPALDSPSTFFRRSDSRHGERFLRRHPTALNFDAWGRKHDLVSNEPTLINFIGFYQLGAGFRQQPQTECFGYHPCELWPDQPGSDQPGYWPGPLAGGFFFNGNGFPMRAGRDGADMYCRNFMDTNPDKTIMAQLDDYQTAFMRFGSLGKILGYDGYEGNWLVPCAAAVAGGSECDFTVGGTPSGCAAINRPATTSYVSGHCGTIFDEVRIASNTARFRVHGYLDDAEKRRIELKNDTLQVITDEVFGEGNQQIVFDRLDHEGGSKTGNNQFLGQYSRSFDSVDAGLQLHQFVKVASLQNSRTRFGDCLFDAELVILRCRIKANIYLHHYTRRSPAPPNFANVEIIHQVTPHVVVEITADLAIRGTLDDGCMVGGQPVLVTLDPTHETFPTVDPVTNVIQYAGAPDEFVTPPRRIRWLGQLNHFSDPATSRVDVVPTFANEQGHCRAAAVSAGIIRVPGAASSSDFHPDDRNRHFDGQLHLRFDQTTGFDLCGE